MAAAPEVAPAPERVRDRPDFERRDPNNPVRNPRVSDGKQLDACSGAMTSVLCRATQHMPCRAAAALHHSQYHGRMPWWEVARQTRPRLRRLSVCVQWPNCAQNLMQTGLNGSHSLTDILESGEVDRRNRGGMPPRFLEIIEVRARPLSHTCSMHAPCPDNAYTAQDARLPCCAWRLGARDTQRLRPPRRAVSPMRPIVHVQSHKQTNTTRGAAQLVDEPTMALLDGFNLTGSGHTLVVPKDEAFIFNGTAEPERTDLFMLYGIQNLTQPVATAVRPCRSTLSFPPKRRSSPAFSASC